jgi:hypothetical protein
MLTRKTEGREVEDYRGWSLRSRLELLAFDARLTGTPPALLEALWEALDLVGGQRARPLRHPEADPPRAGGQQTLPLS